MRSKTHKGDGYNAMEMDDTAGKEKIDIHAQYDMNTVVGHDDTQAVANDRTITGRAKHTETSRATRRSRCRRATTRSTWRRGPRRSTCAGP
jgi:uncharacterized protein involved in type VI secretion and phage assembly